MKNKKTILISTIASLITAIIIYISGGQFIIASLLGGVGICTVPGILHLKNLQKNNIIYTQKENHSEYFDKILDVPKEIDEKVKQINKNTRENRERVIIAPIKQYNDKLLPQLITIDALTQKENILVRIRKKETEEKIKQPKELKK